MTFDELSRTLSDAVGSGKIGTPVSLRLHLQLADSRADLMTALTTVMEMAGPLFNGQPSKLMARQDPSGRQLSLLLGYADGQTVLLTLGCGAVQSARVHLLLLGNHGLIRLEGSELPQGVPTAQSAAAERWRKSVDQSIQRREAITLSPTCPT